MSGKNSHCVGEGLTGVFLKIDNGLVRRSRESVFHSLSLLAIIGCGFEPRSGKGEFFIMHSAEVNSYLEKLPMGRRSALESLRLLIFKIAPGVAESIKYGIPYYNFKGELCAFASQKNYMSLYIFDISIVSKHKKELTGLNVGKSCVRFKRIEDLPLKLIESMLKEAYDNNRAKEK